MITALRYLTTLIIAVSGILCMSFATWQPNYETAKKAAASKHQLIMLNFSGSDWCGPCMRMENEIFKSTTFSTMADSSLVLLNADFPRSKKNQLTKDQQKENDLLADKFNPKGIFPLTVLIDQDGKVIERWEGLPDMDSTEFTQKVKSICNASK